MNVSNQFSIIGRLGKDPEVRVNGETTYADFSVAVDRNYKKEGAENYETDWVNVKASSKFGGYTPFIANHLGKGTLVAVAGQMEEDKWQDQEGGKKSAWRLKAERIRILEGGVERAEQQPQAPSAQAGPPGVGLSRPVSQTTVHQGNEWWMIDNVWYTPQQAREKFAVAAAPPSATPPPPPNIADPFADQ